MIYLLILPVLGKSIEYGESIILFTFPLFLFLNLIFENKLTRHSFSPLFLIAQVGLILFFIISTILSLDFGYSYSALFIFLNVLFILDLSFFYLTNIEWLYYAFIGFSLIYSLVLFSYHLGLNIIPHQLTGDNFIFQDWGHSYLADLLIFPIVIIVSKINRRNLPAFFFPLAIIGTALYLTNSRSALVAAAIGLLFLTIQNKLQIFTKFTVIIALILGLAFIFYRTSLPQYQTQKSLDGDRLEYWHEAVIGFHQSPFFGNGATTFPLINRQHRPDSNSNSNYAHNFILQFLTDNGLIFTLILVAAVIYLLISQFRHDNLLFCLSLAAIVNASLDPSWSSPGIFILSLILLTYHQPQLTLSRKSKISSFLLSLLALVLALYTTSSLASDYFYYQKNYQLSLKLNPFNFYTRVAILPQDLSTTLHYFANNEVIYQHLIDIYPLPQSEDYYYQMFRLDPQDSDQYFTQLMRYYLDTRQTQKLEALIKQAETSLNLDSLPTDSTLPMAQVIYHAALIQWQQGHPESAIHHLQTAVKLSKGWSDFYIELANAYYHSGHPDLAVRELNQICSRNLASQRACLDYLSQHQNNFLTPGGPHFVQSIDSIEIPNPDYVNTN